MNTPPPAPDHEDPGSDVGGFGAESAFVRYFMRGAIALLLIVMVPFVVFMAPFALLGWVMERCGMQFDHLGVTGDDR